MTEPDTDHVARLQARLLETPGDAARARIHLELGRIALRDGRLEVAVRHFKEALVLDRRLESARQLLVDLGEGSRIAAARGDRRKAVRGLLSRFRRRTED